MTRIVGLASVWVALAISVYGLVALVVGITKQRPAWITSGLQSVYVNCALLTLSTAAMILALVTHDFSVGYVAQVGSRATPLLFTVISLWGALEGSILFWGWVLAMYSVVVIYTNRHRPGALVPWSAVVLLGVGAFFYLLLVGPANPWHAVSPVPLDGPGPNPLLQNHILMAVHPPLLYLGYVGLTVPFAFAVGALLSGEVHKDDWIRLTHRWTLSAWAFLSLAIIAGMWWSYEVLGWGGYWAWDPVENASFMPWLTSTAFLHSVMVQERRGMLKLWNVNLIVGSFLLTILGTFLTRSGIISSVHAFTTGTIGYYFLGFIACCLLVSLILVAGNSAGLRSEGRLDAMASRETVFLFNNLLLTGFTLVVILGTLYPLLAEAINGAKVTVGAPFFNRMSIPICVGLLFLMGVGPALPWKAATDAQVKRALLLPGVVALGVALLAVAFGKRDAYTVLAFAFSAYAAVSNLREYAVGIAARRKAHGESVPVALGRLVAANQRRYGGYLAHLGIIMVAAAIAASSSGRVEREATLAPGQTMEVGDGVSVRLKTLWGREESHRQVVGADLEILKNGAVIGLIDPRMNFYHSQEQPVPTPAVRSRVQGDIYANLMAFTPDGQSATLKVILEPFVPWIWIGGLVMAVAATVSAWPTARSTRRAERASIAVDIRATAAIPEVS
ncbi:heme lyase CcmF/NrfE family subunit [Gemmatimonas aurantiaca]|uniref:heme lyase CcmF/NrfE family subunit n=1 Tax=Gemmatimonas aurantiaca TaxID=173480 RepID=UPI00301BB31C